jgi:hypothetical protein
MRRGSHRAPKVQIFPSLVDVENRFLVGRLQLVGLARSRGEERARTGNIIVDPGASFALCAVRLHLLEISGQRGKGALVDGRFERVLGKPLSKRGGVLRETVVIN